LRYVHTIKGNSRTYGFDEIAQTVHEVEDFIFTLSRPTLTSDELVMVLRDLKKIESTLDRYKHLNDVKLERSTAGENEVALLEVSGLVKKLAKDGVLKPYVNDQNFINILKKLESLTSDSFLGSIRPLLDSLPSLAKQLGKKTPRVIFEGEDFQIERKIAEKYEDIFVHLIRNSMDHGFSPHQEGELFISVISGEKIRHIVFNDSGRGLNIKKLRSRGIEKGIIGPEANDEAVARLVFHSGVSSTDHVTDISGRGIGMDAVKAFVAQLGGKIEIELIDLPADPGFSLFRFRITIPIPVQGLLNLAS